MKKLFGFTFAVALFISGAAFAEDGSRSEHRVGVYLGLLGDPFPTLLGFNLGVNATDWLRLVAGYGSISASSTSGSSSTTLTATTIGGGARLFVPGWSFSPVAGLSYANVNVTGTASGSTVGGFSGSGSHEYITVGFDWQAHVGFDFGFGYNYSLLAGVGGLPYIDIGWFF